MANQSQGQVRPIRTIGRAVLMAPPFFLRPPLNVEACRQVARADWLQAAQGRLARYYPIPEPIVKAGFACLPQPELGLRPPWLRQVVNQLPQLPHVGLYVLHGSR